ncbi:uncharacterized protein LOC127855791 [Dreissena polymorpha]|uniref:Uncharacterized protein n=1 Tax=Dreissena polymorpha TaxID=45954 RepID=A0A9D4HJV3_DREPO|nr:uncharacterized protein LOC127855791 [Dreissena polymorpha]KAH3721940.1 hypothetical protein DPMN_064889 [Dreissena polymorpha]
MMMSPLSIVSLTLAIGLTAALRWSSCSNTKDTDVVQIYNIDIIPEAIPFPGEAHLHLNMTFTRNVTSAYVDVEFYKMIFGFPIKVPCLSGTSTIGSCNNVDACHIFRSIMRDPNHQTDYGHQAENVFLAALGHYVQCPLAAENMVVNDGVFHLDPMPAVLDLISHGDYKAVLRGKEAVDGPYTLGCLEVFATIGGASSNPIVG